MKYLTCLSICLLCLVLNSQAQDTIQLQNPSFESPNSNCGEMPEHWINRGIETEAPPSVQPGCLGVSKPAYHGRQYLSLVTRKRSDADAISQKLPNKAWLSKDSTYHIRLSLAYSKELEIPKKKNGKKTDSYGQAAILQLWGRSTQTGGEELLAETQPIRHTDWIGYDLVFRPTRESYDQIQLEAAYNRENPITYNGNILIDSISAIVKRPYSQPLGFSDENYTRGVQVFLDNPSFEGTPKCCEAPEGWYTCGSSDESPPDIQPGSFQVSKPAFAGDTYLGMVVRDNETYEGVGQRLPAPLRKDQAYILQAYLARAALYLSLSRTTGEEVNYATPVILRVWGGARYCDHAELLAESPAISNTEWQEYKFNLIPQKQDYDYITLEAYYKKPTLFPYNGNLLVDEISLFETK